MSNNYHLSCLSCFVTETSLPNKQIPAEYYRKGIVGLIKAPQGAQSNVIVGPEMVGRDIKTKLGRGKVSTFIWGEFAQPPQHTYGKHQGIDMSVITFSSEEMSARLGLARAPKGQRPLICGLITAPRVQAISRLEILKV